MSKRMLFAALACVVAVGLLPASASAGTLDQQQTLSDNIPPVGGGIFEAQVFTPTLDGQLDQVDLWVYRDFNPGGDLTVQIWAVAGGVPSSPLPGASATVLMGDIPIGNNWIQVPISAPSVAGTKYAIVLSDQAGSAQGCPDAGCLAWRSSNSNPYPDPSYVSHDAGVNWNIHTSIDFAFKTYVEPSSASELLTELLADVTGVGPGHSLADKVEQIQGFVAAND